MASDITIFQAYQIGRHAALKDLYNEQKQLFGLHEDAQVKVDFEIYDYSDSEIAVRVIITGIDFGSSEILLYCGRYEDAEDFVLEAREFLSGQRGQH